MKYIIEFTKTGTICYTSHLDIMKVFKRSFKRAGISLAYSQGFNPHPKMGFGQPLSLGYKGLQEYIEFETDENKPQKATEPEEILILLKDIMPEGLNLVRIIEAPWLKKTLAAENTAAKYTVMIPLNKAISLTDEEAWHRYMDQDEIITLKKQKKKKDLVPVNIKPKIRNIGFHVGEDFIMIDLLLDSGSISNLSPELVIATVIEALELNVERSEVEVVRNKLYFGSKFNEM